MSEESVRTMFLGRMVHRSAAGKQGYAYIEGRDGQQQQVYFHVKNCGPDVYRDFRAAEIGTAIHVAGEIFRSRHLDIPTLRVEEMTIVEDYHD